MKHRRGRWIGTFCLLLCAALVLCGAPLSGNPARAEEGAQGIPENTPAARVVPTIPPMQEVPEEEPLRRARIRAVGDLMVHDKQLRIAKQSNGSYDFDPQYAYVRDALANADYTIGNLETTIGFHKDMPYSGFPLFNTPEALLETLRDCGVDFLTLANNHILDRYFDGMKTTVDLVEKYGFAHGGANRSRKEQDTPVIVEVNGIMLGMICCTQMTNGMEAYCNSEASDYGVDYIDRIDFPAKVARLRQEGADVVICLPHWGDEYFRQPGYYAKNCAKEMIRAGVDIILASHPHMVQPVDWFTVETDDGGKRTGLVAYCLGNFISNMFRQYTDSGIILDFTIQEQQDGTFAVEDIGYLPIYCWKRDSMICAVCSEQYVDERPKGMSKDTFARMKASRRELRELLGEDMRVLKE